MFCYLFYLVFILKANHKQYPENKNKKMKLYDEITVILKAERKLIVKIIQIFLFIQIINLHNILFFFLFFYIFATKHIEHGKYNFS